MRTMKGHHHHQLEKSIPLPPTSNINPQATSTPQNGDSSSDISDNISNINTDSSGIER